MGRCLELKPAGAYCGRAPIHPNLSGCWGGSCSLLVFSLRVGGCLVWGASVPRHAYTIVPAPGFPWLVPGCSRFPVKASSLARSLRCCRAGFSLSGFLGKRAKSGFLVPCFARLAAPHPSRSPETLSSLPCLYPCSTAGIAVGWLVPEVSQRFPYGPKMCGVHLAV